MYVLLMGMSSVQAALADPSREMELTQFILPSLPEDKQAILNPNYWDGRVLGQNPVLCPNNPEADEASAAFALDSIETALQAGYRSPTRTYLPGSSLRFFPMGWHTLGTVVAFHQETLFAEEANVPYKSMEDFRSETVAEPPNPVMEMSDRNQLAFRMRCLRAGGIVYQEAVYYGAVVQGEDGKKVLVTVNSTGVCRSDLGRYTTTDSGRIDVHPAVAMHSRVVPKVELHPITIGTVQHFKKPHRSNPRLVRVNLLEVLATPHE
jgi:hypothetical protein